MSTEYELNNNLVSVNDNLIKSLKTCHIVKIHVSNIEKF
jgi:hypothetical protein